MTMVDGTLGTATPLGDRGRQHFQERLDTIRSDLFSMSSLVLENVRLAGKAMVEGRLDLVDDVRQADLRIDQMYLATEKLTFQTLARQQPVAGDLRFLVAATRILYELERSGDLAVNCMKMLDRLHGFPHHPAITPLLEGTVMASCKVFGQGTAALADLQPGAGAMLDEADDEVDDLVSAFYTMVGRHSSEIGLEPAIALSRVGRFLERIADHAVNIGDHITYIVTAELPGEANAPSQEEGRVSL
jgi:phosphate transport system protein